MMFLFLAFFFLPVHASVCDRALTAFQVSPLSHEQVIQVTKHLETPSSISVSRLHRLIGRKEKKKSLENYWIVQDSQGKILSGAGLFFRVEQGRGSYWVDGLFGTKHLKELLLQVMDAARREGLAEVSLEVRNTPQEDSLKNIATELGFKTWSFDPILNPDGSVLIDSQSYRPINVFLMKRLLIPGLEEQSFMKQGNFKGKLLKERKRSVLLYSQVGPEFEKGIMNRSIEIGNVVSPSGFVNTRFKLSQVHRVILQDQDPAVDVTAHHVRLLFEFKNEITLTDPETLKPLGKTKALILNIVKHITQQLSYSNGVPVEGQITRVYGMMTKEKALESSRPTRQYEFVLSQNQRSEILLSTLRHASRFAGVVQYEDWWANCATQISQIIISALDQYVEGSPHKEALTKSYQGDAALLPQILPKRLWTGVLKPIEDFK